ncbi:hypothetical protein QA635_38875 [Bradyrhizobium brasilense]|uniref:hypothetical protein n=1 Tax=Bradyrhizobium brasilense TaxID=1419277 RepID=UPI0024B244B2|nr:hypothetical protein [Bradyrhizobium australafricanum]WFU32378.1 hypothetical protein QA635_38875 [Bradyrhizobium australafricanum]
MLQVTEDLIDQVYEAAAASELWGGVLDRVASQFGSIGDLLCTQNSQNAWAGSSVDTVRRQLKSISSKTGVSRLAELAGTLLGSAFRGSRKDAAYE